MPLLEIKNLVVAFDTSVGLFKAVDGIDVSVEPREVLAIVGESGSGKSVVHAGGDGPAAQDRHGHRRQDGVRRHRPAAAMTPPERRKIIGKDIAMIFQEPVASLNPCFTVGFQIEEVLRVHMGLSGRAPRPGHRTARSGRHQGRGRAARRLPAPDVAAASASA